MTWKVHIDDVTEEPRQWCWNGNDYERFGKHVSVALGNSDTNRHPFDVELTRVAPGQVPCPVHCHSHWWELFVVLSGEGEVHRNGKLHNVGAGDCFMQPAGIRHRIRNTSVSEDLVYYVIANEVGENTTEKLLA